MKRTRHDEFLACTRFPKALIWRLFQAPQLRYLALKRKEPESDPDNDYNRFYYISMSSNRHRCLNQNRTERHQKIVAMHDSLPNRAIFYKNVKIRAKLSLAILSRNIGSYVVTLA